MFETPASEVIGKIKRQILNNSRWEEEYFCTGFSLVDRIFCFRGLTYSRNPCFRRVCFNAPCHFTPLINLRSRFRYNPFNTFIRLTPYLTQGLGVCAIINSFKGKLITFYVVCFLLGNYPASGV